MRRQCACGCGEFLNPSSSRKGYRYIRGHHLLGTARDLLGQTFNLLTVVGAPTVVGRRTMYPCTCQCGSLSTVEGSALKGGKTKSCGCLKRVGGHTTHGMSNTPVYRTWMSMLSRCNNPSSTSYPRYGGLGVEVCERWHSFENFYADMGDKPEGMSIERKENSKGYYKENCKWATPVEQAKNRRSTTYVRVHGRILSFADAVRRFGAVSYHVAKNRVNRDGWSAARAITTPPNEGKLKSIAKR